MVREDDRFNLKHAFVFQKFHTVPRNDANSVGCERKSWHFPASLSNREEMQSFLSQQLRIKMKRLRVSRSDFRWHRVKWMTGRLPPKKLAISYNNYRFSTFPQTNRQQVIYSSRFLAITFRTSAIPRSTYHRNTPSVSSHRFGSRRTVLFYE